MFSKLLRLEMLVELATVLMEVLCVYPWVIWFSGMPFLHWDKVPLSLFSALAILSVTAYVANTSLVRQWSLNKARLATLATGIVLILLLAHLENRGGYALQDGGWVQFARNNLSVLFGTLGFGFYLLWRGIVTGRQRLDTSYVYRSFTFGVAAFIVLAVAWAATSRVVDRPLTFTTLGPYVLGYFFVALMALGLSNLKNLQKRAAASGTPSYLFTRRWVLLLLSLILAIVLVGTLIASTLSVNSMSHILQAFTVLRDWLTTAILYVVLYPLGYLVAGLFYVARFFFQLLHLSYGWENFKAPDLGEWPKIVQDLPRGLPPELILALKWLALTLVVGVIIYLLARALSGYWKGSGKKSVEEIHESLWSWTSFRTDIRSFFQNLLTRLRKTAVGHPRPPRAVIWDNANRPPDIRELYRGLLWEGRQAGLAKRSADTPYEYEDMLANLIPEERESLTALTEAYVRVRYGHRVVEQEQALVLLRLWLRVRSSFRTIAVGEGDGAG